MNTMVVYHYVRDNSNFKAFSTKQFREQLEEIQKNYKIISMRDFLTKKFKEKTCVLTFDDGIKDGFINAFPILEEMELKAIFFIPTSILTGNEMLSVQKRHLLLAELGTEKFVEEFNKKSDKKIIDEGKRKDYFYDDGLTASLKYRLDNGGESIMNEIFEKNFNEKEEFEKMYLNMFDIKKMEDEGHEIGIHGHNHLRLGKSKNMEEDLRQAFKIFNVFFSEQIPVISYPFGNYTKEVVAFSKKLGFKAGVTIDKHVNCDTTPRLALGRFDCIQPLEDWK